MRNNSLTKQELIVLNFVAEGKTNPEIAKELTVETGTAKAHVHSIISKFGGKNRTQAAVLGFKLGLVK